MIERTINWCNGNRFLLFFGVLSLILAGLWSVDRIPLDALPGRAQLLSELNPLHHCVELVRHAAFGWQWWDIGRVGALVGFAVVTWRIAIHAMTRKLVD